MSSVLLLILKTKRKNCGVFKYSENAIYTRWKMAESRRKVKETSKIASGLSA